MRDYGIDNEGSGFAIDADEDINSMFDEAIAAAEDAEGELDFSAGAGPAVVVEESERETPREEATSESVFAVEEVPEVEPEPVAVDPIPEPTPDPVAVTPEPEPAVEAVAEEVIPSVSPAPPSVEPGRRSGMKVPTEQDQVQATARVIRVLDTYRHLNADEKMVAVQFVTAGELQEAEDELVVVKVLNVDPQLSESMRALREAWESEPVERAFYVMALSDVTLHSLGDLVSMFTGETTNHSSPRLAYSRSVVAAISTIDEKQIAFVKATERLLFAAEEVAH